MTRVERNHKKEARALEPNCIDFRIYEIHPSALYMYKTNRNYFYQRDSPSGIAEPNRIGILRQFSLWHGIELWQRDFPFGIAWSLIALTFINEIAGEGVSYGPILQRVNSNKVICRASMRQLVWETLTEFKMRSKYWENDLSTWTDFSRSLAF